MKEALKSFLRPLFQRVPKLEFLARSLWALLTLRRYQSQMDVRLATIHRDLTGLYGLLERLELTAAQRNSNTLRGLSDLAGVVHTLGERIDRESEKTTEHTRHLATLDRGLANLRAPAPSQMPNGQPAPPPPVGTLDFLYAQLEERFRGASADIADRQKIYLADIAAAVRATGKPVLDLGAGRGEWLAILRDAGIVAKGVDSNVVFVDEARDKGLAVAHGDLLAALSAEPENALGAITGFHIVEHLRHEDLISLIDAALRALAPGGCLIVETPNPDNLLVATRSFFLDPTHRSPLPGELTRFLLEARGFARVEIRPLHPYPDAARIPASTPEARILNDLLYSAQDYAAVGFKTNPAQSLREDTSPAAAPL